MALGISLHLISYWKASWPKKFQGSLVSASIPTIGALGLQIHITASGFHMDSGGPNICSYAYTENGFSVEPHFNF